MNLKDELSILSRMSIGSRIRSARKRAEMTIEQLAGRLGVTGPAVGNWERGENNPTTARLEEIAKALGTTVEWLTTTGDDEAEAELPGRERSVDSEIMKIAMMKADEYFSQHPGIYDSAAKVKIVYAIYDVLKNPVDNPMRFDLSKYPNIIDMAHRRR